MTDAYMLLIIDNSQQSLERVLESIIHSCGLSVGHPDTGFVIAAANATWLPNLTPDRLYTALDDSIHSSQTFTLQLWWEEYWDIVCKISSSGRYLSLNFSLDGVREINQDKLHSALIHIAHECASLVMALIVDFEGKTAEIDFEAILASGIPATQSMPDVFLVSLQHANPQAYLSNSLVLSPINDILDRVLRIDNPVHAS